MRLINPHLNNKINSSQQTPANNAAPKMSVQVSRARTTVMDSDYWTVETIRKKDGLGDVSVAPRRYKPYGTPNRIYEIHVDNGMVETAIREYPDRLRDGWKNQFVLGPGTSVAIAFDGNWQRYRKRWRLVTDEKPWIFWVDTANILWSQHWDNVLTRNQLDTDVIQVRAIRAWKNVNISDKDQGIVAGYIKTDGTIWYRNYCQQVDYNYAWESARQITQFTGTAVNLNIFITNDYRMGFVIEDNSKQVHWLITPRNWAGMAVEHHTISVTAAAEVNFIPVKYYYGFHSETITVSATTKLGMLFGRTDNTIVGLENLPMTRLNEEGEEYQDWGFIIRVKLNFPSTTMPTFTVADTKIGSLIPIKEVVTEDDQIYDIYIDDSIVEFGLNTVEENVMITIVNGFNEAGYQYDDMIAEFTPVNLVPPSIPVPEVEAIWNE